MNDRTELWERLYMWLNDMQLGISPDESTPDNERACRIAQTDIIEDIMGWIEANVLEPKALEKEPCEDCISRAEVRRVLGNEVFELTKLYTVSPKDNPKLDAKIGGINWSLNTLMELPPVIPKGITVTDFADKCRECGREKVLDKIRERVELEKLGYPPSADYYKAIMKVLQIIDKYKAESEVKDGRLDGRGTGKN